MYLLSAWNLLGQRIPEAGIGSASPAASSDSLQVPQNADINWDSVKISPDALDEQVDYQSKDSMYFDIRNKKIHMYEEAQVLYQEMTIKAAYIQINWKDNLMEASGRQALNQLIGKPSFVQGEQNFTAANIKYNFKTYKGVYSNAQSMQQGLNVVGEKGKFIGAGQDSTKPNIIYNKNAIFSTCELEHPHFGIRSSKQKIVQDKVAVVGPCNLVIGDVPTPLWFPFGFFPLKTGKRTGLIFPQNYEYSEAWGFGLENMGWYFPMGEHWDLSLTGDVYLKGTFRVHARSNYRQRYKYSGSANVSMAYLRTEVNGMPNFKPSFIVNWSHNQDTKAHPYRTFGGSINLQTSDYQRSNQTDAASRFQNSLNSNMSFRQRFDQPFDFSLSFNHSQNTSTRDVNISFPTFNFQTQNLFPFKRKVKTGGERWYERVQMRYTSEFRNQFTAKDSTLFTRQTLEDAKFGARHNVNASTSFTLLKYFTFSPSANYKEVWYFKSLEKELDSTIIIDTNIVVSPDGETQITYDTLQNGKVVDIENVGFKPFREYNAGISMSTKVFGTLLFKRGTLRGLRHVITPTFGFNFSPDYTNPDWGYFKTVRKDLSSDELIRYNIFENNRLSGFGTPSSSGRQMNLSYGFGNLFEAKIFSKRDSTLKNIKLFNGINVAGNYNFAADSLNWSQVNIGGNTNLFNGISSFRFSVVLDPYDINRKSGARINQFYLDTHGKLLRLAGWNSTITTNITVARLRDLINGVNTDQQVANRPSGEDQSAGGSEPAQEDFLSLLENFSISHNFTVQQRYDTKAQKDTITISTHSIASQGTIKLTQNWYITVGNFGYDFTSRRITYPDFSFSRDLHCWEMGVSWQPYFSTYSFYIRVKPGKLDFINIPYRKGIQDGRRR
ncbi:MAG: hypothetical protein RI973_811 [Bacteroidota bacterium]